MPFRKNTSDVLRLCIAEFDHLSKQPLTPEEIAALYLHAGVICEMLGRFSEDGAARAPLSQLAECLRPCYVEAVAKLGGSPLVCANVRRHQAKLYEEHLASVRKSAINCMRSLILTARNSGQWWWWTAEHFRMLTARYYLGVLWASGILYRMGARVRIDQTLRELSLLCHMTDSSDSFA